MASNWAVCGVCDSLEITKPSVVWCSECDEGLCTECDKHHAVSKASRTHSTLHITEYKQLPTDILKIAHTCSKHNDKFQTYCKKHDCPCCHRCVIEAHNECKDIIAMDDIIKDVKSSNALYEIELMLAEVAENLEKIAKDRKDNLTTLKDQRRKIENEIQNTRLNINSHFDQIQEKIMKKLNALEEKERKKIEDLLAALEKKKKEIDVHKTTLTNVKQYASEYQTYLAIKQMETKITIEERFLETLASSGSLKQICLSLNEDEALKKMYMSNLFGQIEVEMRNNGVMMTGMKGKQAQWEVVNTSPRLIEDIKLNLKQTIKTGLVNTTGCLILNDRRLAFSCRTNHLVRFFSGDGDKDFEIILKPQNVFDITFIPEDNTIAATSGDKNCINIIEIKDRKIRREISIMKSWCYGIVYNDSKLMTSAKDGLHILQNGNSTSEVMDVLKLRDISAFSYVAYFDNKLYYTNNNCHTVTCCDTKGTNLWTFKDEGILKFPRGISADNDGNIYVASAFSCRVIVISSDGKRCLELLGSTDGLSRPTALDFDRKTKQLLVSNEKGYAFVFQVSSKN